MRLIPGKKYHNSNGEEFTAGDCSDCRAGEHEDYIRTDDETVPLVFIRDPSTKKIIKRAKLCVSHREQYADDGYEVNRC